MKRLLWMMILASLGVHNLVRACIWDSDTLSDEKKHSPTLAKAILSPELSAIDPPALKARIEKLRTAANENDPAWWNDLAGAHIRLGEASEAVKILEPLTNKFATDYGIHANLGTAYHLLGRYADAEREIARDLEINPDAHFGLEKYHLALLQYLIRDEEYRLRHVYIDEFTESFLIYKGFLVHVEDAPSVSEKPPTNNEAINAELGGELRSRKTLSREQLSQLCARLEEMIWSDKAPAYRSKWNLGINTNLEKGVTYMAELNAREPACWTMLGLLAEQRSDKNLTIAAFEKAIQLGSPQASILQAQIDLLKEHIAKARKYKTGAVLMPGAVVCVTVIIAIILTMGLRAIFRSGFQKT